MTTSQNIDFDRLIDYFEGKLTAADEKRIDARIAQDATFAKWVDDVYEGWLENPEGYRSNMNEFHAAWQRALNNRALQMGATTTEEDQRPKKPNGSPGNVRRLFGPAWGWLVAAGLAGVILYLVVPKGEPCSLQDTPCLIAREGGPYLEGLTTLGSSDDHSNLLLAVDAYAQGNYLAAIPLFEALLDSDLSDFQRREIRLLLGISHLQTGDAASALSRLLPLRENTPADIREEATWYAALAYLAQHEPESATPLLVELRRQSRTKAEAAARLLDRLGQ